MQQFIKQTEQTKVKTIKRFQNIPLEYFEHRNENFNGDIEIIEWEEIQYWVSLLSEKIKDKKYVGIYGIPRGGIIIATLLSYKTKLPMLSAPCKNCLIVDDGMSTGLTMLNYIERYDTAVMYKNPKCPIEPKYKYQDYGEKFKVFVWNKEFIK